MAGAIGKMFSVDGECVYLSPAPLYHSAPLAFTLGVQALGGTVVVMERFEDFFGGATAIPPVGKACVERVVFKPMPQNEARIAALLAGEVEIVNELPLEDLDRVGDALDAYQDLKAASASGSATLSG